MYCVISQSFFWIFPNVPGAINKFSDIAGGAPLSAGVIWLSATILLALHVGQHRLFCSLLGRFGTNSRQYLPGH